MRYSKMANDMGIQLSTGAVRYLEQLDRFEIPDAPPVLVNYTDGFYVRDAQIDLAGFSVITKELIPKVDSLITECVGEVPLSILEVCAGNGWWSKVLQSLGHRTTATDDWSWDGEAKLGKRLAHPVEKVEAIEAAKQSEDFDLLVIAWPCDVVAHYKEKEHLSYDILQAWEDAKPGRPVLYIGEGDGGCCASPKFFHYFDSKETIYPFNYGGIHENIEIGYFDKDAEEYVKDKFWDADVEEGGVS